MREDVERLVGRFEDFAVAVIGVVNAMPSSVTGRHIGGQLLRSGTSTAANYEEACAAESRADFVHKLMVALKEMRESRFWLRLITRASLLQTGQHDHVLREADELCNILAKSVVTAKNNAGGTARVKNEK